MSVLKRWTGSVWEEVGSGGIATTTVARLEAQTTAPSNPAINDIWIDKNSYPATQTGMLLSEQTVSGAAVTSVTFSGLDGNAHGGYFLVCNHKSAANNPVSLFINGDTTQTNYYTDQIYNSGTTTLARSYANTNQLFYADVSSNTTAFVFINRTVDGYVSMVSDVVRKTGSFNIEQNRQCILTTGTVTNITSITLTHQTASGMSIGTSFALYRRK